MHLESELKACPSAELDQFTANTMACVSEAIGLALNIFCWYSRTI